MTTALQDSAETPNPSPDVEKLIERLRGYSLDPHPLFLESATALQSLSSENARLKEERDELLDDISRLTKQRDRLQTLFDQIYDRNAENHRRAEAAESSIKELEKALEPFAKYMGEGGDKDFLGRPVPDDDCVGWIYLTHADFRRARAVLTKEEAGNA